MLIFFVSLHRETKKTKSTMRAFKGFNKNEDGTLMCMDMVYEPGKTYKYDGGIAICKRGFHACHELWQVWLFYPNDGNNVFYEVECGGKIIESEEGDGKFVCSEITIVKEVDVSNIAKFDDAYNFSEGFAEVKLDGKHNFINTEGKLLSKQWFECVWNFSEGFAMINLKNKYNFVNTECKLLSEQWFDDAWSFHEGFARVKLNGKWSHINTEGKLLSKQWFNDAWNFSEGFSEVELNGKWMKINKNGNLSEI